MGSRSDDLGDSCDRIISPEAYCNYFKAFIAFQSISMRPMASNPHADSSLQCARVSSTPPNPSPRSRTFIMMRRCEGTCRCLRQAHRARGFCA